MGAPIGNTSKIGNSIYLFWEIFEKSGVFFTIFRSTKNFKILKKSEAIPKKFEKTFLFVCLVPVIFRQKIDKKCDPFRVLPFIRVLPPWFVHMSIIKIVICNFEVNGAKKKRMRCIYI